MSTAPVARELRAPLEPLDALARLRRYPLSLAFISQGPITPRSRYSYVMADPQQKAIWRVGDSAPDPFHELAKSITIDRSRSIPGLPPFQGGWAGMVGYGYGRSLEKLPRPLHDEFQTPDIVLGHYRTIVAFDRLHGQCWLIANHEKIEESEVALNLMESRLLTAPSGAPNLTTLTEIAPVNLHPVPGHPHLFSHFSRTAFEQAIHRAIEYIRAGDCFQINLAQRLCRRDTGDPFLLMASMARANPAPFSAWLDWGTGQVISASPERFLMVDRGTVETRPIKGTRPRSADPSIDSAIAAELLASPKDRAENIMIVDLLRNDLGKVCAYGSVRVPRVCELESYPSVHHMVSEVVGRLTPGKTPLDLLRACFPGGSVTGAPKIRSMELITELEQTARGPYCGSMFWLGHDGNFDSSILIRTVTRTSGWLTFPVGGGIVADSTPGGEYDETMHKASGILAGIETAIGGTTGAEHVL